MDELRPSCLLYSEFNMPAKERGGSKGLFMGTSLGAKTKTHNWRKKESPPAESKRSIVESVNKTKTIHPSASSAATSGGDLSLGPQAGGALDSQAETKTRQSSV